MDKTPHHGLLAFYNSITIICDVAAVVNTMGAGFRAGCRPRKGEGGSKGEAGAKKGKKCKKCETCTPARPAFGLRGENKKRWCGPRAWPGRGPGPRAKPGAPAIERRPARVRSKYAYSCTVMQANLRITVSCTGSDILNF
eukprot:SAG22_NODE_1677_length_3828_cov_2.539019_3_plen_140_part_00